MLGHLRPNSFVVVKRQRERALGSTTTKLFGKDCFRRCDHICACFAIVESSAIVQRDLLRHRCRTGTRTNGLLISCCAQSSLPLCPNSTNVFTKTRASRESASRECRPQTRLGVTTTTTTESTVAARVINETKVETHVRAKVRVEKCIDDDERPVTLLSLLLHGHPFPKLKLRTTSSNSSVNSRKQPTRTASKPQSTSSTLLTVDEMALPLSRHMRRSSPMTTKCNAF